ncbi:MAG: lysophospholipid acyltransferase family protein [Chitinophagaceae bacterium]
MKKKYNIFIQVFARIWALWGLLSFVGTFLIIFLPSMLSHLMPYKKGQDYFIAVSRWWMRVWLALIACPLKVRGLENFKPNENYIVTYNHNTFLDVPLSCPFMPSGNVTIAKKSFAKVPIFGWFYKRGSILVDRNSDKSRRESFEQMKQVLAAGLHMGIYPEGTRNRTNEPLKKFYDGAFKLAVDTQKEILPCVMFNTSTALPTHKTFWLLPTKLYMQFLPPIASKGKSSDELKSEVFNCMYNEFVNNKPA